MTGHDPEISLAHFVGGMWRAPLGARMVPGPAGFGCVVAASNADMVRARDLSAPASRQANQLYQALLADMSGQFTFHGPPPSILHGAVFLAHPLDAPLAIALARRVAQAGLAPGCFAMMYADQE
jgi:hypothetical protein